MPLFLFLPLIRDMPNSFTTACLRLLFKPAAEKGCVRERGNFKMDSGFSGIGSLQVTENDVMSSSTELFRPVSREVTLKSGRDIIISPINTTNSDGPFDFECPAHGDCYLQMSQTRLYGQFKIVNGDGTNLAADANVGIVNMAAASLFKAIEVEVNGNIVSDLSAANYHYKAYLETLLSYGSNARNTHLRSNMFKEDTPEQMDSIAAGRNTGLDHRKTWCAQSRLMDFMIPLSSDFLMSDRLLPPGTNLKLKLTRNPDRLLIMAADAPATVAGYKVHIEKLRLHLRLQEVFPDMLKQHLTTWKTSPVQLPINRTVVRQYHQPAGVSSMNIPGLFTGKLPKSIIIGMVTSRAYNAAYHLNPYNFQHFNLNYACIRVNGVTMPAEPYQPNFARGLYMREYRGLFENTGVHHDNLGSITYEAFARGTFLQAYDLSPDKCNGFHFHAPQEGNIELTMQFSQNLDDPITIIVYSSYDAEVLLHPDGSNVTVAYAGDIPAVMKSLKK